jgi:hypothetical protein
MLNQAVIVETFLAAAGSLCVLLRVGCAKPSSFFGRTAAPPPAAAGTLLGLLLCVSGAGDDILILPALLSISAVCHGPVLSLLLVSTGGTEAAAACVSLPVLLSGSGQRSLSAAIPMAPRLQWLVCAAPVHSEDWVRDPIRCSAA